VEGLSMVFSGSDASPAMMKNWSLSAVSAAVSALAVAHEE